jgi:hypothetical protein
LSVLLLRFLFLEKRAEKLGGRELMDRPKRTVERLEHLLLTGTWIQMNLPDGKPVYRVYRKGHISKAYPTAEDALDHAIRYDNLWLPDSPELEAEDDQSEDV